MSDTKLIEALAITSDRKSILLRIIALTKIDKLEIDVYEKCDSHMLASPNILV